MDIYIKTKEDLIKAVEENGIIPFFANEVKGFSLEEIALVQGASVGIVKYRMHQARKKLRVEWNGKEEAL